MKTSLISEMLCRLFDYVWVYENIFRDVDHLTVWEFEKVFQSQAICM